MKLAHLADVHLGFRMYEKTNARGANQREADVARAFSWAVDDLIAQKPEIVVVAGDVFHNPRPTNAAIMFLFKQLQRIREALPRTAIGVVAGDHDTPRTSETSSILPLYTAIGAKVHVGARLLEATLADVPFLFCASGGAIDLKRGDRKNVVLLCHGEDGEYGGEAPTRQDIPKGILDDDWLYCALGHHHVMTQVGPRAWYAGSLDYVSTDPYGEVRDQAKRGVPGKGYLLVDLETGTPEFRIAPDTRRHVDLDPIDSKGMGAETLNTAIAAALDPAVLKDAVVRLVVRNVAPDIRKALDFEMIRARKALGLHVQLDMRRPEDKGSLAETVKAAEEKRRSLVDQLDEFLGARDLPDDIDRIEIRKLGREYLERTADKGGV